jgi:hypothetical protein
MDWMQESAGYGEGQKPGPEKKCGGAWSWSIDKRYRFLPLHRFSLIAWLRAGSGLVYGVTDYGAECGP